jgi:hypothetical protein
MTADPGRVLFSKPSEKFLRLGCKISARLVFVHEKATDNEQSEQSSQQPDYATGLCSGRLMKRAISPRVSEEFISGRQAAPSLGKPHGIKPEVPLPAYSARQPASHNAPRPCGSSETEG